VFATAEEISTHNPTKPAVSHQFSLVSFLKRFARRVEEG